MPSAGAGGTGQFKFDSKRWAQTDRIVAIATLVLFVSLFLPWFTYNYGLGTGSVDGLWHGWMYITLILCLAIMVYLVMMAGFSTMPFKLPLPHEQALLIATGINFVLIAHRLHRQARRLRAVGNRLGLRGNRRSDRGGRGGRTARISRHQGAPRQLEREHTPGQLAGVHVLDDLAEPFERSRLGHELVEHELALEVERHHQGDVLMRAATPRNGNL